MSKVRCKENQPEPLHLMGDVNVFTKQFFEGLGYKEDVDHSGIVMWMKPIEHGMFNSICERDAQQIALEVLIREKNREIDVGSDLIGVIGINQAELARQLGELRDDLTKLEKLRGKL